MIARAGLIIPSSNRMVEQEMIRAFPAGVQPHVTRLRMTGAHRGPLDRVLPQVEEATRALTDARCEVVAFHCTANSMQEGQDGEGRLLAAMTGAGASRATTTATAIRRAFAALGARRIVLLTPYSQQTTDHEAEFLRESGCQVLSAIGFALAGSDAYCATPPAYWHERVSLRRAPTRMSTFSAAPTYRRSASSMCWKQSSTVRLSAATRPSSGTASASSVGRTAAAARDACFSVSGLLNRCRPRRARFRWTAP